MIECPMAARIGQVAQELARQNPWWRGADWTHLDPELREARQSELNYRPPVLDDLSLGSVYILRGPRRVGKTVTVKQTIAQLLRDGVPPTAIVRFAADGWSAKDLRTLISNVALPPVPEGHSRYWFIDEISSVSGNWDQQLKWLRDNDSDFREATVVLTGSNATGITEATGALAGRRGTGTRLDRTLMPMGFRTFAQTILNGAAPQISAISLADLYSKPAAEDYAALLPWLDELVNAWEAYLRYGGYPKSVAAYKRGETVPAPFINDLFNVISADAFKASRLSSATEMALLERLWQGMASPVNLTAIAEGIGVGQESVARHLEYLRDAYLLWNCPPKDDRGWLPRTRAQRKVYAIDPLIARLPHLMNMHRTDIDPTVMTEMQIGLSVRRRILTDGLAALSDDFLFFQRTPSRKEIDFLAEALGGAAIEGKYIESGRWRGEAATVDASPWNGILVTRNVLDTSDKERAWAVPAGILAYLIDT